MCRKFLLKYHDYSFVENVDGYLIEDFNVKNEFTYIFILPTMPMQKLTTTPLTFSPIFCLKIISIITKNAHNNIVTYKQLTTRRNR